MLAFINFYHYSLILFFIISLSFIYSKLYNKSIEETLSTSILSIVFFLYWFAIFDFLDLGLKILIISTSILTPICLFLKRSHINRLLSIGVLTYITLVFIVAIMFKDYFIYMWDDLSHWGLTAKDMYFKNSIVKRDYNDYPIGIRLFQYFILKIYGNYNEGVLLTYFYIIYFSFVVYPLKNISFRSINNCLITLLYSILALLLPMFFIIFDNFSPFKIYRFLMVDLLLGLTFGFAIYIVLLKKYFTKYDSLQMFLLLFFLVQIKIVGLMFAVCAFLWIILRNKSILQGIKEGLFFVIPILLSKLSWLFYIKYHNYSSYLSDRFDSSNKIINFNDFLSIYINALNHRNIFLYFSVTDLLMLFFATSIFFIGFYRYLQFYIIKLYLLLFTLFLVYNLGLYFTYMNVFHDIERVNLFSFERYQNLLFSGFIFILFLFLPKLFLYIKNYYNGYLLTATLVCFCSFFGYFSYTKYSKDINIPNYAKKLKSDVLKVLETLPKNLHNKNIVMISDDFPRLILRYNSCYNVLKYTSKEKPDLIVLYNKEKYKEKIIDYIKLHQLNINFAEIKVNVLKP
jgi:hypothetical protein